MGGGQGWFKFVLLWSNMATLGAVTTPARPLNLQPAHLLCIWPRAAPVRTTSTGSILHLTPEITKRLASWWLPSIDRLSSPTVARTSSLSSPSFVVVPVSHVPPSLPPIMPGSPEAFLCDQVSLPGPDRGGVIGNRYRLRSETLDSSCPLESGVSLSG